MGMKHYCLVFLFLSLMVIGMTEGGKDCQWEGQAPFCAAQCSSGYKTCKTHSSGDGARCWTGEKAYCCSGTPQFLLVHWIKHQPLKTVCDFSYETKNEI
uniref:LCN-type CS-alpha/beta domain-containing protein n=1 Tax=Strigamia maritima TaxID=126957 RepID=T1JF24_STRMM